MTTLRSVAARIARTVRCIAIGYIAVQVIIWHSFFAAHPWLLAGPAVALLWASAAVAYLRRHRWPVWQAATADSLVHVALALGAMWCVPPAMRGDAANWLYIAVAGELFIPTWFAPTALSAPLALASAAAYWTGSHLTATAVAAHNSPAASAALLLALAAANWSGRRLLYRWATRADAALDRADCDARAQYVVLTRNIERREHERLLHDTVLNTLTALARAGTGDAAVGRCRHDITLMEDVLSDPGEPDDAGGPGDRGLPGSRAGGRPYGGLLISIEAVANEMRARGLNVHLEVGAPAAHEDVPEVPAPAGGVVPAPVAAAFAHAVREALANVTSHAGTGEAWVEVTEPAPGTEVIEPGGLQVTVRDAGAGFDPARVDPARLGLRRSIVERIADSGGRASIRSAPGEGTVVTMHWTAPAQAGHQPAGPGPRAGAPAAPRRDQVLPGLSRYEIPRTVGTVALVWQLALFLQVLIDLPDYRQPAVPLAVWLGLLAAAAWLVPRTRAGGLTSAQAAGAIVVAVTAVALVGWNRAQGATGTVDWSVFGTGWLLMLVAISRPIRVWVFGALLIFTAHAIFAIRLLGGTPLSLARLAVTAYTLLAILAVFTAVRWTLETQARMAARRSVLASRSAAERAATVAVQQDRRGRLAVLEVEALPLLRGMADGTLNPADSDVRGHCTRHAATLRRALADASQSANGVLADLEPALRAAKARGLPVEVQVVGDPGHPMREVAGATLAAVGGVMSALPPHPVILTVLASGDDVELYMTFDMPLLAAPDMAGLTMTVPAAARWRSAVDVDDTGSGCLEVRWRKALPA